MAKIALLIGVSDYGEGLAPLPGALKDIAAMAETLENTAISGFDEVLSLPNPNPMQMQEAIESLFSQRGKNDLALLFFSGHGIKDDSGRLYFATPQTRKTQRGDLVKATAVPATFVQDIMSNSRCRRQLVILDCCFSGAFAEGMTAKSDANVDIEQQLGGEGRAVLTSSTATQYSFEAVEQDLSVYTCYIVEGLKTGAADTDGDGHISVDELHEYASRKVQETSPAMKPKIFAIEEGFKIQVAKASMVDPSVRYRKAVEQVASRGEISAIGRYTLNELRVSLRSPKFTDQQATIIEQEVLKPYRDRQRKLKQYEQVFADALRRESPLSPATREELDHFQQVLQLRDEDFAAIENQVTQRVEAETVPDPVQSLSTSQPSTERSTSDRSRSDRSPSKTPSETTSAAASASRRVARTTAKEARDTNVKWLIGGGVGILVGLGAIVFVLLSQSPQADSGDIDTDLGLNSEEIAAADQDEQSQSAVSPDSTPEAYPNDEERFCDEGDHARFRLSLPNQYECLVIGNSLEFYDSESGLHGTAEVEPMYREPNGQEESLKKQLKDYVAYLPSDRQEEPRAIDRQGGGFSLKWSGIDELEADDAADTEDPMDADDEREAEDVLVDGKSWIFPFDQNKVLILSMYEEVEELNFSDYGDEVKTILGGVRVGNPGPPQNPEPQD